MRGHNNSSGTSKVSQKNQNNNNEGTILLPKNAKDVNSAQDTIYLCNFRVSVDGEWLCLKELQDGMQNSTIEGAPDDSKKSKVASEKCNEKIVERDWVNYYCRCFLFRVFLSFFLLLPLSITSIQHKPPFIYDLVALARI
jgi:hypothetical protein